MKRSANGRPVDPCGVSGPSAVSVRPMDSDLSDPTAGLPGDPSAGLLGDPTNPPGCEQQFAEVLAGIVGTEHVSVDSNFFEDLGADSMLMARFCARVRKRPELPSVSMQDVYQHPTVRSLATALAGDVATMDQSANEANPAGCEQQLAEVLAGIVGTEHVAVDSNFFDDLGADSMLMARFCARVRKHPDLPSVSMQDVYQHPTIRSLAVAFAATSTDAPTTPVSRPGAPAAQAAPATPIERPRRASSGEYVVCGALQLLVIFGYPALIVFIAVWGYDWVTTDPSLVHVYLRAVAFDAAMFVGLCTVPVLVKWVLIGRWKPQEIRIWSMAYLRFWFVKTLTQVSPMALFLGSPLYALYLRSLGAKVGRGAVILAKGPVCTDLFSIGDNAVIRKDSVLAGYRADDGVIQTGPVSIGRDALVGEAAVLDIFTSLGDGAQLGHSSALLAGQAVPDGERWHGSPAQPTDVDYRRVPTEPLSPWRPTVFGTVQLANVLLLGAPLAYVVAVLALTYIPQLNTLMDAGPTAFDSGAFYLDAVVISLVTFFGAAILGLLFVRIVPGALNRFIEPGKVYPLYGFHYWVHRALARTSNSKFYMRLLGDTSAIVHYLRWIGYDLQGVRQSGSNFGEVVKHDNPHLVTVRSGTMVADGLSIMNTDFSNTSFRMSPVSIGAESFLGNRIAYPAQAKTGDNCLLATRVMIPVDGPVRENVGLLGAPCFEIPRKVRRDQDFDVDDKELRRGLHAKNLHNTRTLAMMLLSQLVLVFILMLLYLAALDLWASLGAAVFAVATVGIFVLGAAFNILLDRLVRPFMCLRPQGCSIYDPAFWGHERYWKIASIAYLAAFNGTPFRPVLLRLLGARIGRRVFDDGAGMPERRFTTVGDECTLNAGSVLQCHSQEDGGFKSDRIELGARCTLGVNAWVHYGVRMGDGAKLGVGSFLMKGEEVPPGAVWGGNPAKQMREQLGHAPVPRTGIEDHRAAAARHRTADLRS
jgi:non-ribosomal peptide synthetase-like protein